MRLGSATPLWLFGDHLGSTSLVANSDGSLNSELRYKAWGEIRFSYGTVPTTFRYTGQREESSLGLYYYGARWYDPALSRWIQPDSLIPEITQGVQAWDRFAYVNNSPVMFNDPSGHCLLLCTIIIGAAVGAIVGAVGYTAFTIATGTEFNAGNMLLTTGAGAAVGAIIGSGVGLVVAAEAAVGTGTTLETANIACGGDACVSEVQDVGKAVQQLGGTVVEVSDDTVQIAAKTIDEIADDVAKWVSQGENLTGLKNKAGDFILRNVTNTRRFRFDYNNTGPHDSPHMHLDWINELGEWVTRRIWPSGIKPE